MAARANFDVAIVGASLSGCTAAILLSRAGARVALIEKNPDPAAYKRLCSHFIQAPAVPTLERLGLMEPILVAGGQRARGRVWTRWGWIEPTERPTAYGVNLRREVLDPLVRAAAAATPGVEFLPGWTAVRLLRDEVKIAGVAIRDPDGADLEIPARLTIAADGRDSPIAGLAEVREQTRPHGRFAYAAYFEGPLPDFAPDAGLWMMDPQVAAAFPTDNGLVLYVAMPTKDHLPKFKEDIEGALVEWVGSIPEAPPIRESRRVGPMIGKLDMTNRIRGPVAPGLALVGDAALAADPLFGVGCGWAFQSGEWLADSVSPSLRGIDSLENGLRRYRKRHRRGLGMHARLIHGYSTGRKFDFGERLTIATAVEDRKAAALFEAVGTRRARPQEVLAPMAARILATNARRLIRAGRGPGA
ncbi:MAG TPA: NAD(P)/FAD-dependent oxidoreductase [Solirubrobacterales bacterium]|nr:NAD(P)/FAD-dependent oxidoreductase [Solirubrobacterales bacterium]